jgi:lysophospholipase L1-like esterase
MSRIISFVVTLLASAALDAGEAPRFLALGDSYTSGEGVAAQERWPSQLAAQLRAQGTEIADPEYIARTGASTAELAAMIRAAKPQGPYALVSLQIGVNDQFRGYALDEYRHHLTSVISTAVALAGGRPERVIACSIPDWGVTPFATGADRSGIARSIDAFNGVFHEEIVRAGARWIDVTASSRAAGDDRNLIGVDGLHPSSALYGRWAALALPTATEAIAGSGTSSR